ncbi:unnamed protein product [Paramecium octaurelia]|uniref:Protein kinase domain-containing protein n=1 Tax=Paramecium octaurelia TaxID=43137 RepID=A0A8S1S453_PAROT|nr:unnamed protein product [Paramecium octaurelia]
MIQSIRVSTNFHKQMEKLKGLLVSTHTISPIEADQPIRKTQTPLIGQLQQSIQFSDEEEQSENIKEIDVKSTNFNDEFVLGRKLGEGTHGIVKLCWKKDNPNMLFAVKIITTIDEEHLEIVRQTFINSTIIKSPYIAKCYKLYIDINVIYMLMEYVPYSNLQTILQEKTKLKEHEVQKIANALLKSVRCLHSCGVCHRDIKPDNIMIDQNDFSVKLIDFGVSRRFVSYNNSTFRYIRKAMLTVTGNLHYRAPEIMFSQSYGYNQQIDLWAIGVTLYQSLTGSLPFISDNTAEIIAQLSDSNSLQEAFQQESFLKLSTSCRDLIKRLLMWNPLKRLTASEALKHIWIPNAQTPKKPLIKWITKDDMNTSRISQNSDILNKSLINSADILNQELQNTLIISRQIDSILESSQGSNKSLRFSIKIKQEKDGQDFKSKLKQFKLESSINIYSRKNQSQTNAIQLVGAWDEKKRNSIKLEEDDDIFGIKVCRSHHSLTQFEDPLQVEQQPQNNQLDPKLLQEISKYNLTKSLFKNLFNISTFRESVPSILKPNPFSPSIQSPVQIQPKQNEKKITLLRKEIMNSLSGKSNQVFQAQNIYIKEGFYAIDVKCDLNLSDRMRIVQIRNSNYSNPPFQHKIQKQSNLSENKHFLQSLEKNILQSLMKSQTKLQNARLLLNSLGNLIHFFIRNLQSQQITQRSISQGVIEKPKSNKWKAWPLYLEGWNTHLNNPEEDLMSQLQYY